MSESKIPPRPSQWLTEHLATTGQSRANLARLIGRSREEVTRWASGREQIPRYQLAEIASQLASPSELDYVMRLKDCEELTDRLKRITRDLSKILQTDASVLTSRLLVTAGQVSIDSRSGTLWVSNWLHSLSAAIFATRTWHQMVTAPDGSPLIDSFNIGRHLQYPVNYFIGSLLSPPRPSSPIAVGATLLGRELGLAQLRSLAREGAISGKTPALSSLIRHHALHMLARHGDRADQEFVTELIDAGTNSSEPLARKLAYCGLIMRGEGGQEVADEYLYYLTRDKELATVDLAFDATHYGDHKLHKSGQLELSGGHIPGLSTSLLSHFDNPARYSSLAEVDSFRLLQVIDAYGPASLPESGQRHLQKLARTGGLPIDAGPMTRLLERRSFTLFAPSDRSKATPLKAAGTASAEVFDIFLAHNSADRNMVKEIAQCLTELGLKCWLDEWELRPGQLIQEVLESAIEKCRGVAVFIGSSGIGKWERMEFRYTISLFVEGGHPVIPVILDGRTMPKSSPPFLREFHAIFLEKCSTPRRVAELIAQGISSSTQRKADEGP